MDPVLISHRCGVGTAGAAGWGASDWAATGAVATRSTVGGEDLMRGLKTELWPPWVLAIWEGGFRDRRNE